VRGGREEEGRAERGERAEGERRGARRAEYINREIKRQRNQGSKKPGASGTAPGDVRGHGAAGT
jgi:hypothetical protein